MDAFHLAALLWLAIFILWAILGSWTKRTVGSPRSVGGARGAVWVVFLAWAMLFNRGFRPGILGERFLPAGPTSGYVGLALTIVGLGFAAWARFAIGRNWGGMITVQQDHQLVQRGPYAIVRHPIYSGFILATLGTAIALGEIGGLVSAALVAIAWGYKARLEESFMVEQFGSEYEEYRRRVKGLVPGVF